MSTKIEREVVFRGDHIESNKQSAISAVKSFNSWAKRNLPIKHGGPLYAVFCLRRDRNNCIWYEITDSVGSQYIVSRSKSGKSWQVKEGDG